MDDYEPQQVSTFALTLFRHATKVGEEDVIVGESKLQVAVCERFLGGPTSLAKSPMWVAALVAYRHHRPLLLSSSPVRLLGHCWTGAVQRHAPVVLSPGPRLPPGQ